MELPSILAPSAAALLTNWDRIIVIQGSLQEAELLTVGDLTVIGDGAVAKAAVVIGLASLASVICCIIAYWKNKKIEIRVHRILTIVRRSIRQSLGMKFGYEEQFLEVNPEDIAKEFGGSKR